MLISAKDVPELFIWAGGAGISRAGLQAGYCARTCWNYGLVVLKFRTATWYFTHRCFCVLLAHTGVTIRTFRCSVVACLSYRSGVGACLWGTRPLLIGAARDAALLVLSIARLLPVLDSVAMPPRHYAHALICSVDTTGGLGSPGRLLPDQNLASAPPSDLSVSHRELSEKYTYVGGPTRSCDNVINGGGLGVFDPAGS